jgi:hypothetical membrane protein
MCRVFRKIFEFKNAALLGALSPICAAVFIGISIALSPWFSWTHNALSDLGVSEISPIFNSGLMLSGILLSIFAFSFTRMERKSRLGLSGAIVLFVTGISVFGVGVFTEKYIRMHILFALTCFGSMIISSIILGLHFTFHWKTRKLGILTLSAGPLSLIVWFAVRMPGIAIKETLSVLAVFIWFIVLTIKIGKEQRHPKLKM